MTATIDLLKAAKAAEPEVSNAEWTRRLGITDRTAINVAESRGHLSPTIAGQLARYLKKPVAKWTALAALESAKPTKATQDLKRLIERAES